MAPPPRKALIAVTSAHAPLYLGGKETGLFITEALHPFETFKKAGFGVDLSIASTLYSDGDIISAVCHSGAIFPGVIDDSTGRSIISGQELTGFTTQGEIEAGVIDTIKLWNGPRIEAAATSAGAKWKFHN
ncbi:MAG: hypothetical protein L6R40_007865 [Gallowayella cf. fulva]|nr:MAG: hypothetical protein L6R40_007865 [Xanthomendoza cf. fulva]